MFVFELPFSLIFNYEFLIKNSSVFDCKFFDYFLVKKIKKAFLVFFFFSIYQLLF